MMRRLFGVTTLWCLFSMLATLNVLPGTAQGITVGIGGGCANSTQLNDLSSFTIVGNGGGFLFCNTSAFNFTDLKFVVNVAQAQPITGDGTQFFPDVTGTTTELTFVADLSDPSGRGIGIGEDFSITLLGFSPNDVIFTVTPSAPEPATLLLLGSGLAGLAGFRSRRKWQRYSDSLAP